MKKTASDLVQDFVDAIIKQRQAIFSGSLTGVSRYRNKITPPARKLVKMGDEGIREFATLLQHPIREIRATAAVYLISSLSEESLAVFRELAEGDDLVALGAQMRIKEWEEHPEHYDEKNWAP